MYMYYYYTYIYIYIYTCTYYLYIYISYMTHRQAISRRCPRRRGGTTVVPGAHRKVPGPMDPSHGVMRKTIGKP